MMDENTREAIKSAVDVSAAMDNCFFHSFALHLIANNQPFPEGLFDPDLLLDDHSLVQLKETFKPYQVQLTHTSDYLFENTLILGVLLRSWFINQLMKNEANKNSVLNDFTAVARRVNEIYAENSTEGRIKQLEMIFFQQEQSGTTEQRLKSFEEVLFDADSFIPDENHESRFNTIKNKLKEWGHNTDHVESQNPITQLKLELGENNLYLSHHDFFNVAAESNLDDDAKIKTYWTTKGYQRYCAYLAKPGTKIAFEEVKSVLDMNGFAYNVFDKKTATLLQNSSVSETVSPVFEVALNAMEGHYYLLTTTETEKVLQGYSKAHKAYSEERSRMMEMEHGINIEECLTNQNILLAATLPVEYAPFDLLMKSMSRLAMIYSERMLTTETHSDQLDTTIAELTPAEAIISNTVIPIASLEPEPEPEPELSEAKSIKAQPTKAEPIKSNDQPVCLKGTLKKAIKAAQKKYAEHYRDNTQSKRGNNGWFSWFRHGQTGQNNAQLFCSAIEKKQTAEEVIKELNAFFNGKNAHYHRHSFAAYLLDALSEVMIMDKKDLYSPTTWENGFHNSLLNKAKTENSKDQDNLSEPNPIPFR